MSRRPCVAANRKNSCILSSTIVTSDNNVPHTRNVSVLSNGRNAKKVPSHVQITNQQKSALTPHGQGQTRQYTCQSLTAYHNSKKSNNCANRSTRH